MSSFDTMFDLMSLNNKCSRETNRNNKTIKKLQESRKPVKEGRWNKTLDNAIAKKLRNAIDEENLRDVLDAIKDGYYWIAQQDDYSYDETDVESDIEDFDYIDDNEEAVNYELDKFYDVCDALRIWVPTHFEEACGKKEVSKKDSKKDKKDKVVTEDTHGVNTDNIKTYPYKVKEWYHKEYPDDDIWEEIDSDVTFFDVYSTLRGKHDVYDVLGVGDSVVRERVFDKLSEIGKVDYDVIYNMWLGESKKSSKAAKKLSEKVDPEALAELNAEKEKKLANVKSLANLSVDELKQLRADVVMGSIYLDDYENRFGIDPDYVYSTFEGYTDYLRELMQDEIPGYDDSKFYDYLDEYDTPDHMDEYFNYMVEWSDDDIKAMTEKARDDIEDWYEDELYMADDGEDSLDESKKRRAKTEAKKSSKVIKKLSEKADQEFFDEVRKFFIVEERNGDIDTTPIVTKDLMDVINTALYRWRYGHSSSERRQCNSYYVCSMIDREDGNGDWYSDFDTMKDYVDIIELDKWLSKNRGKSKEEYPDDYYDEEKDIELYLKEHR